MLSFIIPAYNEELELPLAIAAIRAAAANAQRPHEIVVVDDASTDATAQIAADAGAQVLRIARRHIAAVRNAGARAARGKVLFFVDADTQIHPTHVVDALAALNAGYSGGSARIVPGGVIPLWARFILLITWVREHSSLPRARTSTPSVDLMSSSSLARKSILPRL